LIEIYFSNNQIVKKVRKNAEKLLKDVIFRVKGAEKDYSFTTFFEGIQKIKPYSKTQRTEKPPLVV